MREIALNILDIAENSVKAKAKLIMIDVVAKNNILAVSISDDGIGMSKDMVAKVTDPFVTTRTTRKVGFGIPFFKMSAEMTGGSFHIESQLGKGTTTTAKYVIDSIDRMPLGNLAETMVTLLSNGDEIDYVLTYSVDEKSYCFDTRELKQNLNGISVQEPEILNFVKELLNDNIASVNGGKKL